MMHSRWLNRVSVKHASAFFLTSSACLHTAQVTKCDINLPPVSVASIKGGRDYMEDEYFVHENDQFKLLAVYDGHGGKDVAKYMRNNFYQAFEMASTSTSTSSIAAAEHPPSGESLHCSVTAALREALAKVDKDMLTGPLSKKLHFQGATSCMVYLEKSSIPGCNSLISANVGDSRAILARGGQAVNLSEDHKPDLPAERARVEGLGGVVSWHGRLDKAGRPIENTGIYRVNRNLALSRSMGDRYMRPYVTSEPDFQTLSLTADDEFVVVATDGLWDVMSSEECVKIIQQILREYSVVPKEVESFSAADKKEFGVLHAAKINDIKRQMSSILTSLALRRGSTDNITILIQWLR